MKATNSFYYGKESELPANLPAGSEYRAIDTLKNFIYDGAGKPHEEPKGNGPKGEKGEQGEQGLQGPKGDDGNDGWGTEAEYNALVERIEILEGLINNE